MKISSGLQGKTFSVQGFGNVGYWASKFLVEDGAKLIGVAEFDGSIYDPNGIDPEALWEHKMNKKGINGYKGGGKYYPDESAIYSPTYIFLY